ncbi:MAG: DegT/DnrJ/EryC1/StrS aminotransferase family protein [Desulfobacterales bacterium]|nr:MAG: DegT/DnrJ/EryC1/StrS aminotransferase family protein [Desulfobacterales bacterium]
MKIGLPLMENNITPEDIGVLIDFLEKMPKLTQNDHVRAFEKEWSEWLGVKHSVFVNSGASANFITISALKHHGGPGEIIVPPLTWISDIAAVVLNGFRPVFVDIDPQNLCMSTAQVLRNLNVSTRAVFLTHVQGFSGLTEELLVELQKRNIPLIEDVCESHGATFQGQKLGSFGWVSNFSFYYGHHMSTIEGGMACTNDETLYNTLLMMRSHGMVREAVAPQQKSNFINAHPDLNPDFIFAYPAFNMRGTEIGGVLGRSQLKRLDANNAKRRANLELFLELLDPAKYRTDFALQGSCNYAFPLVIRRPDLGLRDRLERTLREAKVEFRRGSSGGGNQLRQPYLQKILGVVDYRRFPEVEHIHHFGYYIGNYPSLEENRIRDLCHLLNSVE